MTMPTDWSPEMPTHWSPRMPLRAGWTDVDGVARFKVRLNRPPPIDRANYYECGAVALARETEAAGRAQAVAEIVAWVAEQDLELVCPTGFARLIFAKFGGTP
jgi:hypothetical protein